MTNSANLQPLRHEFTQLMLDGVTRLQREIGYNASRFRQMVLDSDGVETAHALLRGPKTSEGFATLWEAGRLELSLEAHVLLPRFQPLFTDAERAEARDRLERHRFDVDAFLKRIGDDLP